MRRFRLNCRSYRFLIAAALGFVSSGCGEKTLPDTPPGSSRAQMENPLGAANAAKEAKAASKETCEVESRP